jgi:hypothetical protein
MCSRARWRATVGAVSLLAATVSLAGCGGGGDTSVDKLPEQLNFSAASAADAGVFGASKSGKRSPSAPSTQIQDDTGAISVEVPQDWKDHIGKAFGPWQAALAASPSFDDYSSSWDVPGIAIGASKTLGKQVADANVPEIALVDAFSSVSPRDATAADCDPKVESFLIGSDSDNPFSQLLGGMVEFGLADLYSNCGGNGAVFGDLAGLSKDHTTLLYLQFTLTTQADIDALQHALETLQVDFAKVPEPTGATTGPDFTLP